MSISNSIRAQIPPIHPEGYPFIGVFALVSLILFWVWTPLGWIGTALTLWCALFFRDPVRVTPVRDGVVVSPADGRVSMIAQVLPPAELGLGDRPLTRVSVFMSVFNCHVNRSPIAGRIEKIVYRPGVFINAELDKASEDNERMSVRVDTADDIAEIEATVGERVAPLGHRVDVVVNYDHFSIRPELMDDYTAMVRRLTERWYGRVTRYAAAGFLKARLGAG